MQLVTRIITDREPDVNCCCCFCYWNAPTSTPPPLFALQKNFKRWTTITTFGQQRESLYICNLQTFILTSSTPILIPLWWHGMQSCANYHQLKYSRKDIVRERENKARLTVENTSGTLEKNGWRAPQETEQQQHSSRWTNRKQVEMVSISRLNTHFSARCGALKSSLWFTGLHRAERATGESDWTRLFRVFEKRFTNELIIQGRGGAL